MVAYPGWDCDALAPPYDREAAAAACVGALQEAKSYGMRTLVDATPNDLGRDVELQKIVADRMGINIILKPPMSQGPVIPQPYPCHP